MGSFKNFYVFFLREVPPKSQRQDLETPRISDPPQSEKKSVVIKKPVRIQQPEKFQVPLMSQCLMLRRTLTPPSLKVTWPVTSRGPFSPHPPESFVWYDSKAMVQPILPSDLDLGTEEDTGKGWD
ncbi:uncharacterized protein LOC143435466 isoform X2 [Arvicanthis niloticus]|uniref:uncharacterized protein LOC143309877 isoform X2 n=1 Tax=Arvicanthis niloticus TaxID=61156 RepID=UPI00402BC404